MITSVWFLTNHSRLGHLTNQSRAALREAGFRETESLIEAFQTLREKSCSGYYEKIKVFLSLDECEPVVAENKNL